MYHGLLQAVETAKRKADEEVTRLRTAAAAIEAQLRTSQEQLKESEARAKKRNPDVNHSPLRGAC